MGTSLRIDCGPGSHIVFFGNMANHLLMVGLFLLAGATLSLAHPDPDDECPFGPGSCPVTLDNVVDVYFHDVDDIRSCQRECRQIEECKFFTMFPESDNPHDHMKCFLFKTCDHLEACDDCMTRCRNCSHQAYYIDLCRRKYPQHQNSIHQPHCPMLFHKYNFHRCYCNCHHQ